MVNKKENLKHIEYTEILTEIYSKQLKKVVILKKGTYNFHIKKRHPEIVDETQITMAIKKPLYITTELSGRYDIYSIDQDRTKEDIRPKWIKIPVEETLFYKKDGTETIGYDVCTATFYRRPHFKKEDVFYDFKNEDDEE